jgi:[CysO sulfur-carrier protein]-S-L-cysteine hydrolase
MTTARLSGRFDLDRSTYDAMIAQAHKEFPFEACGLLAGEGGAVRRRYEIPNAARSMTFYNMEPKALLDAMNDLEERGWELLGIYHSHTHTEAFPSRTDVELAFYPEAAYLIVSLQHPEQPAVRAFDIVDGRITERVVHVDGEPIAIGAGPAWS